MKNDISVESIDAVTVEVLRHRLYAITDQIEGKESKMISSIAPNPGCKDFRLKLIDAE